MRWDQLDAYLQAGFSFEVAQKLCELVPERTEDLLENIFNDTKGPWSFYNAHKADFDNPETATTLEKLPPPPSFPFFTESARKVYAQVLKLLKMYPLEHPSFILRRATLAAGVVPLLDLTPEDVRLLQMAIEVAIDQMRCRYARLLHPPIPKPLPCKLRPPTADPKGRPGMEDDGTEGIEEDGFHVAVGSEPATLGNVVSVMVRGAPPIQDLKSLKSKTKHAKSKSDRR